MKEAHSNPKEVYAVCGADTFRKHETVVNLCRLATGDDAESSGPTRFAGPDADIAEVLDEVRTFSLLGGRRVVIVDDADPFITKNRPALEKYCGAPVDSGTLILVCNSLPANTRLYKIISQQGEIFKCEPPRGQALMAWMQRQAKQAYGKGLDSRAAWLLRELVGDSSAVLDGELNKLSVYVGERQGITTDDVEALIGDHREKNVFGVTDAMASGDTGAALHQWERVLATDRAAPGRAIGGLAWGIRRLLELKRKADSGVSLHALARQAYTQPDVLKKRLDRVRLEDLQDQLSDLLDADLASKTGLATVATAVERFIVKHAGKARKPWPIIAGSEQGQHNAGAMQRPGGGSDLFRRHG